MALHSKSAFFSQEEHSLLRDRVFELLDRNGVRMDHPVVLERLAAAGARVDAATKRVRFPAAFLEGVLERVPRRLKLCAPDPRRDLEVPRPDGSFHVRTGTGAPFYLDPLTGEKRQTTIADVGAWARLIDGLDGIDFCPFPSPSDVPPKTADVHALRSMLGNTGKHVWVQPYSAESLEYLLRLAAVVVGGEDKLRERPIVSFITCSLTPLDFKFMDLEVMVQACPRGVPVHPCSLPSAGTTSPITLPGTIVLASAEILAMIAVAQTLQPGAPVVATPLIFFGDMATGSSVQSSVEAMQGKAAAVEFLKAAFGVPTHTYGWGSDAPAVDGQSMVESSVLASWASAFGCDILGGAGQLEVATTISPVQLVIDEEMARVERRFLAGPVLNDDTLAWAELLAAEPGQQFMTQRHTLRHCREAYRSGLLIRDSMETWREKGAKGLSARALERYQEIAGKEKADLHSPEVLRELDAVVRAADERLAG